MPPHLHPRSRATGTLFTSTLAISFLVVAAPHFLPSCPVDRRQFADTIVDENGTPIKRRRRKQQQPDVEGTNGATMHGEGYGVAPEANADLEMSASELAKRECPVPKPGGMIGQVLGFKKEEGRERRPAEVVVKQLERRKGKEDRSAVDGSP